MNPTEHEGTVAVEAAAKALFEQNRAEAAKLLPPKTAARLATWEEETDLHRLAWRTQVAPLVWAALTALPDRSRFAWFEGNDAPRNSQCPYPIEEDS